MASSGLRSRLRLTPLCITSCITLIFFSNNLLSSLAAIKTGMGKVLLEEKIDVRI